MREFLRVRVRKLGARQSDPARQIEVVVVRRDGSTEQDRVAQNPRLVLGAGGWLFGGGDYSLWIRVPGLASQWHRWKRFSALREDVLFERVAAFALPPCSSAAP